MLPFCLCFVVVASFIANLLVSNVRRTKCLRPVVFVLLYRALVLFYFIVRLSLLSSMVIRLSSLC